MKLRFVLSFYLLLQSFLSFGQSVQLNFGYGFGKYTAGINSMKYHALVFNEGPYEYWTKDIKVNDWMRGGELEFRVGDGNFAYVAAITHRRSDFNAGGINPTTGFDERLKMKFRLNHFSFIGAEFGTENLKFGLTICEIGKLKVFKKFQTAENPELGKWDDFYDGQTGLSLDAMSYGSTFSIRLELERIHAKLSWYIDWFGVNTYLGRDTYSYVPNNLFFTLSYSLIYRD